MESDRRVERVSAAENTGASAPCGMLSFGTTGLGFAASLLAADPDVGLGGPSGAEEPRADRGVSECWVLQRSCAPATAAVGVGGAS